MSEFCANCPMSGLCKGQVESTLTNTIGYETRMIMGYGPLIEAYDGRVGVILDAYDNPSVVMKMPSRKSSELPLINRLERRLDLCTAPLTETRGILRKTTYATDCPALGHLAVNDNVRPMLQEVFNRELL